MYTQTTTWQRMIVALVVVSLILTQMPLLGSTARAEKMVTLREGREIMARLLDDGRSRNVEVGDELRFEVIEEIQVHDHLAIEKGAVGTLVVDEVKRNGMLWGKAGHVVYGKGTIPAVTRSNITIPVMIKGTNIFKGKSRKWTAILLTPLIFGLFMRGGQGGVAQGETILLEVTKTLQAPAIRPEDGS